MKRLSALLLFFISIPSLYAQVTIGMDYAPVEGALLQLKQTETSNDNSKKGLGLPRVKLTSENNLFPMFAVDPNNDNPVANELYQTDKSNQDLLHVGLLVYNINPCLTHMGDSQGLQVWDGAQWNSLTPWAGGTVQGISGKIYKTATFGDAEWMVEDLEEIKYDTQSEGTAAGLTLAPGRIGYNQLSGEKFYVYYFPSNRQYNNTNAEDPVTPADIAYDRVYYDNNRQYGIGLFYSWAAATANKNTDEVSATSAPGATAYSTVQGICPNGWRIPSERDWMELEKEISDNSSFYSNNPETTSWNPSYEIGPGTQFTRGGHANSMKSPCTVAGYTPPGGTTYVGYSKPNGFNLLMVGYDGTNHQMDYFGTFTALFSSSLYKPDDSSPAEVSNVWGRAFSGDQKGVRRDKQGIDQLQPIRCVKAR